MSGRWVVVDDTDPGITYTGPWYEKGQESFSGSTGYGTPWGGSQHGTNGTASLSYTFTGQSIRVFGTSAVTRNLAGNVTDPHWSCTLGTMELQPYKPWSSDINNWPLCEGWAAVTGAGEQTFVLKTWSESGKSNFWIDQIRYLPLPDSTSKLSGKVAVSLEESDPELVYTGQWDDLRIGSLAKATTQAGASVTLNFSGTKVTWVGWKPAGYGLLASQATYSLDGGPATTFDIQGLPNAGDGTQYYQHIFETPEFPAGQHSLTVTYNGGVNSAPLSIDYLVIANGDLPQSVSQSGSGFARESTKLSVQAIVAIVVPVVLLTVSRNEYCRSAADGAGRRSGRGSKQRCSFGEWDPWRGIVNHRINPATCWRATCTKGSAWPLSF